MAPEVFNGEAYDSFKADIWSLGLTLYYTATGELLWSSDPDELMQNLSNGFDFITETVPKAIASVIKRCITKKQEMRPGVDQLVAYAQLEPKPAEGPIVGGARSFLFNMLKPAIAVAREPCGSTRSFRILKPIVNSEVPVLETQACWTFHCFCDSRRLD
jgi:serine/threonine protein kinase